MDSGKIPFCQNIGWLESGWEDSGKKKESGGEEGIWRKSDQEFRTLTLWELERAACEEAKRIGNEKMAALLQWEKDEGAAPPVCSGCSNAMRYQGKRPLLLLTTLGEVSIMREYYTCAACRKGLFPQDLLMGFERSRVTPELARRIGLISGSLPFEEGSRIFRELTGIEVDPKRMERVSEALGEEVMADEIACVTACPDAQVPHTTYMGLDGTGTPMRSEELEGRKGKQEDGSAKTCENKLVVTWTANETDAKGIPVRDEGSVRYTAKIERTIEKDEAGHSTLELRVMRAAIRSGFIEAARQVVVADAAAWIWNLIALLFPLAICIVDFFHALERLSRISHAVFGAKNPKAREWFNKRHQELDAGKIDEILHQLQIYAPRFEEAAQGVTYFKNNRSRMDYPTYRAMGLCTSSGVVEASCKTVVGARLKRSGMRWTRRGANAISALRCSTLTGEYDEFWKRRMEKRAA